MGLIKDEYEKSGSESLPHFLLGAIRGTVEWTRSTDKEKIKQIKEMLDEYKNIQDAEYNEYKSKLNR